MLVITLILINSLMLSLVCSLSIISVCLFSETKALPEFLRPLSQRCKDQLLKIAMEYLKDPANLEKAAPTLLGSDSFLNSQAFYEQAYKLVNKVANDPRNGALIQEVFREQVPDIAMEFLKDSAMSKELCAAFLATQSPERRMLVGSWAEIINKCEEKKVLGLLDPLMWMGLLNISVRIIAAPGIDEQGKKQISNGLDDLVSLLPIPSCARAALQSMIIPCLQAGVHAFVPGNAIDPPTVQDARDLIDYMQLYKIDFRIKALDNKDSNAALYLGDWLKVLDGVHKELPGVLCSVGQLPRALGDKTPDSSSEIVSAREPAGVDGCDTDSKRSKASASNTKIDARAMGPEGKVAAHVCETENRLSKARATLSKARAKTDATLSKARAKISDATLSKAITFSNNKNFFQKP